MTITLELKMHNMVPSKDVKQRQLQKGIFSTGPF